MTKYNSFFKQQVIEFYLQNEKNLSLTRQHFQLAEKTITRWVNKYNHSGINGFAVLGKKRIYSSEFKLAVIQAVKNGLFPKPKEHPTMKPKYPKIPQLPKTEKERYPKKVSGTQPSQNTEKANVVKLLRNHFPLEILLTLIGLKRSTFFYHPADKVDKNAGVVQKVVVIYHENKGNYGYRRITLVLRRMWIINHKRVWAIMQKWGLKGKCKRRKYRSYQGEVGKIADNLPGRNYQTTKPNEKWVTDVTEFKCKEGKLYLSPIKDLFNEEIITYNLARNPNFEQISRMIAQDVARLNGAKPILHSDQGWQYQMAGFRAILKRNGIKQSMSKKGNCLDNGAMESFFGRLKTECYFGKRFETFAELEQTIHDYIH